MSDTPDRQLVRRRALGLTVAASPVMLGIREKVVAWFDEGVPEDEIRRRLSLMAVDDEHMGLRGFLGLNRKTLRMPAGSALVAVAQHYAQRLGKKKVRDALAGWMRSLKLDYWFAEYQIEWYKRGEPPEVGDFLLGGVIDFQLGPKGDATQIVSVVAGPGSDPEQLAHDFLDRCAQRFPKETWMRKGFPERDARRFAAFQNGMTDAQIADTELEAEGWPYRAADDAEYKRELRTRTSAVRKSRQRWLDYVTRMVDPVSRDSDAA
jgi:hypothetical protein